MLDPSLRIFVGWDSREDIAYKVCKRSIERHASIPVDIRPIKQYELRGQRIYTRSTDTLSSTEFSFTRFLTPYLAGYTGWAVFVDCDFLFRGDIAGLIDHADGAFACMVVKHDYRPTEAVKMDNKPQHQYPRKNWSSMMLLNCSHPQVKALTPAIVNSETGLFLHRFQWLTDDVIGDLPITWNYLEGWYDYASCPNPQAVHFTRGGPWFADYRNVEYANEWNRYARYL
jgi:lipopolysaccharide biosynthesis glycosyltransferase